MVEVRDKINIEQLKKQHPLLENIIGLEPTLWLNPNLKSIHSISNVSLTKTDIYKAKKLWERFAPYLERVYPELRDTNGLIESPLKKLTNLEGKLNNIYQTHIKNLYLKSDDSLPIAGSIKARGGFYEVLYLAEKLALKHGLITKEDDYSRFGNQNFKDLFNQYTIGVGSTGNLALSIGIIGTKLGFNVSVHMSYDAKEWKKELLRQIGVNVYEYLGDFGDAIKKGRKLTYENPKGYFIDDEDSEHLFLGYSTAAFHLKDQLEQNDILVDEENPLFLYLPCGVGGSPGGITFGVKHIIGDHAHCFFVEPTHCPSLLIGLLTGMKDQISVQDIGIDNITEADGLAVGRPSAFATDYNDQLISGIYTIEDDQLFKLLALLIDYEETFVEPSATSGLLGPKNILKSDFFKQMNIDKNNVTHIVWSTGGSLIPQSEKEIIYQRGKKLLK